MAVLTDSNRDIANDRSHSRPSLHRLLSKVERRKRDEAWVDRPEAQTATLADRFERGVDLWTGLPLDGSNAEDWLHLQYGIQEPTDFDPDQERDIA